jgi:orotate phosphoribosyltransferase
MANEIMKLGHVNDLEEKVVLGMFDRGLLGFPDGGITLKSGRQSPYYYNDRPSLSFDYALSRAGGMAIGAQRDFRVQLAMAFAEKFKEIEWSTDIDHVFGKAQAATAPAAVGAFVAGKSYLWERVDEPGKEYGAHKKIEGNYEPGQSVLLGDDVVTDGKSKAEGAQVLRDVGLNPVAVTIKFDREEGGMKALADYGFAANSVTSLSFAVPVLKAARKIGGEEVEALAAYHEGLRSEGLVSTYNYSE